MIVKVRSPMFATVLQRQTGITGGEALLFIEVIMQAYDDLVTQRIGKTVSFNREAVNFFFDGRMDLFAEHISLDADYVREMLLKAIPALKKFTPPLVKVPQQPACHLPARSHSSSIGWMVGSDIEGCA